MITVYIAQRSIEHIFKVFFETFKRRGIIIFFSVLSEKKSHLLLFSLTLNNHCFFLLEYATIAGFQTTSAPLPVSAQNMTVGKDLQLNLKSRN